MDLRQLNYFIHVANHGGFNRAASHLHVAQSALSRQINLLELELKTALFTRSGSGTHLTEAGKLLRARAEVLLSNVRTVREEVMAEAGVVRGECLVGMPPSLEMNATIPLLQEMRSRHPGVFLKTWVATSVDLRDLILSGSIDMAVIGVIEAEPILASTPLFTDDMYIIGRAGSLPGDADPIGWTEIAALPFILTSRPNSVRLLVERAAAKWNQSLNVVMEVNYVPVLMGLVRRGVGYTLLPRSALDTINPDAFSAARVTDAFYEWVLVSSKETELSAAARATRDVLIEVTERAVSSGCFWNISQ